MSENAPIHSPELELIRETPWIKEWRTPWGVVVDSKLRWFGVPPDATGFLADWQSADPPARQELEAAFVFFPYETRDDIERILTAIGEQDPDSARRMRTNLFQENSELTRDLQRFQRALSRHLENTGAPRRLAGENKFFAVFINDGGFYFDTKVESIVLMPDPAALADLQAEPGNLAYQRAIELVRENLWLLEPAPGEALFPGMEDLEL